MTPLLPRCGCHQGAGPDALGPGSSFRANNAGVHHLSSDSQGDSVIYIRSDGPLEVFGEGD